ncbi:MFS transporter [Brevibacillus fulvus]|uniref:OPA family glycerol-3-phosphate transporter-like MFS transporter n=1 Tax=Brevibacillus fulvus TaxID=1125967 RepID=A0A938XW68_9BACL|nr:MFS transporter [Brevibacillus fulvus]MBM7589224.1 OPA family glycerol-3-phosphate transporter-like MFS transporter [Brevibacillus fulvus]
MLKPAGLLSRELTEYPVGRRRTWLLFIAILANFIASYEAQIAPVLPLLLNDLDVTLTQYGVVSAISVIASAISGLIIAPLSDKYGRVKFLVPGLFLTAICVYGMALVGSLSQLLLLRIVLAFVDGMAIGTTAGLVRDFSPRLGRALAFGFWTFGPVGSNFFAAAMAGWTLPIFNTWQSQFIIGGTIAMISAVVIMLNIYDLSPQLRAHVIDDEEAVNKRASAKKQEIALPKMRDILRVPHIWSLSAGISLFLLTYMAIAGFGPKILVDEFQYEPHRAAAIAKYFWLFNLLTLLIAGWISDRLQLRKIVSLIGAILFAIYMVIFLSLFGKEVSEGAMVIYTSILGGVIGVAYGPWCALFSENAEDVNASLQSSAWAVFSLLSKVVSILSTLIAPMVVEAYDWGTWLWIAVGVGVIVYIPCLFTGKGPWLRSKAG